MMKKTKWSMTEKDGSVVRASCLLAVFAGTDDSTAVGK